MADKDCHPSVDHEDLVMLMVIILLVPNPYTNAAISSCDVSIFGA